MSLNEYMSKIESLEFQIQFSVVGGLRILRLAMSQNPTLVSLIDELRDNSRHAKRVFERIDLLLLKVENETRLSLDESIAAYLFCLAEVDPLIAYRACVRIIEFGGLWWSVQLAHQVKEDAKQKLDNFIISSEAFEQYTNTSVKSNFYEIDANVLLSFVSTRHDSSQDPVDAERSYFPSVGRNVFEYGSRSIAPFSSSFAHIEHSKKRANWSFAVRETA